LQIPKNIARITRESTVHQKEWPSILAWILGPRRAFRVARRLTATVAAGKARFTFEESLYSFHLMIVPTRRVAITPRTN